MEWFYVLPNILTLALRRNRNLHQCMKEVSSEVEKWQHVAAKTHLHVLLCSNSVAEHHLGEAETLADLLLMLRPVLQNLVQPAPGLSQVQLQGVQDRLLVLLQDGAHALEVLSNLLLHHLCAPLQRDRGGSHVKWR